MKTCTFTLLSSVVACLSFSPPAEAVHPPTPRIQLLVPSYFYPAGDGLKYWESLLKSASDAPITAIVNPATGPGRLIDANYSKLLQRAAKSNITLIGYVSTSYGKRTLEDVRADMDQWKRLYPEIQGVFLDEQFSGPEKIDWYAALHQHAREKLGWKLIISNPGTICNEQYFTRPATDVVCLFEGPMPFRAQMLPKWKTPISRQRVAILSYQIPKKSEMQRMISEAVLQEVGWIYVTDHSGSNPWDRLPGYWEEEVQQIAKAVNAR